jgi:amino acid adenylation domain-containing protein/non-ribosomal peptide synthase protein (TIGR01720 family)
MQIYDPFTCYVIGEGTLPIQCTKVLLERGHEVYGIISPDPQLVHWTRQRGIPYLELGLDKQTQADHLLAFLGRRPFDYLFSVVNYCFLPKEVLALPRQKVINYHDAPLPKYAGICATSWAIMQRETAHGITWHVATRQVDAGDVIKQRRFDILPDDTALTLNMRCYETAISVFAELIDDLACGQMSLRPQNLDERTYFSVSKRPPSGCTISWDQDAQDLGAFVRALEFGPYPNRLGLPKLAIGHDHRAPGKDLENPFVIVSKLDVLESPSDALPGTIVAVSDDALTVSTKTRQVVLRKLLTVDGQPLPVPEAVARFGLGKGYRFEKLDGELAGRLTDGNALVCRSEAFWVNRLAVLQPFTLPYAAPTIVQRLPEDSEQRMVVPASILSEIDDFLASQHPTWRTDDFLSTAFVAYLARLGGVNVFDIGFGATAPQAGDDGALDLTGLGSFFAQYVPLRVHIDPGWSFEQVHAAVQAEVALVRRHHTYARDLLARYPVLDPGTVRGSGLVCPIVIEYGDLEEQRAVPGRQFSLVISQTDDHTACHFAYDPAAIDEPRVADMMHQFVAFLSSIVLDGAQQPLWSLQLLTEAERCRVLDEWNDTRVDYSHAQEQCIHRIFEAQVERTPDAVAIVFGDQSLTYRDLDRRAGQLAHHLQGLGVGPDVLVGVCMERSLEMVIALYGILKAGGAYVPLDPTCPQERVNLMAADVRVSIVLTQSKFTVTPLAYNSQADAREQSIICLDTDWETIAKPETEFVSPLQNFDDNLAYVIYTSGSTGKPKGVMNTHGGIRNRLLWMQEAYRLDETDRVMQKTPFSFDVSVWEFFWPLLTGACLVVAQPEGHKDSDYLVRLIVEQDVTTMHFVPSMLRVFVEAQGVEVCRSLRRVICSGEALSFDLQERFFARLDAELHNLYGPTEAAVDVTYWPCRRGDERRIVPIGRPIANTQIYVLDARSQPVPAGVPGELHIGGAGLARGYLNRPDLTAAKFVPNPFALDEGEGTRLYRSGDLVRYLPDGNIEFLGRIDYQVKVRGFRIELGEIEAVLAEHPSVREAIVLARQDIANHKRLVAYLVLRQGFTLAAGDLRDSLGKKLPGHMIPSFFVPLEALPLMPNGKVNRRALPPPEQVLPDLAKGPAPRTPAEKSLAQIWAQVLGVEHVGIQDDFFDDLGGDSILGMQVIAKANQVGFQLTPTQLLKSRTVAGLAALISTSRVIQAEQGPVVGSVPLTPIQHWFFEQHLPEPQHWNQSFLFETEQRLSPTLLRMAVRQLLVHHDALRLRFERQATGWQQSNADVDQDVPFIALDFSHLPESDQDLAVETEASRLHASLNLEKGPLMRIALFDLGSQRPGYLFVVIHHLAVDIVSWQILVQDLRTAYQQLDQGKAVELARKTTSFQYWARRLEAYAQREALGQELSHWLAESRKQVSRLPVDHSEGDTPGGGNVEASVRTVSVSLTVQETQTLLQKVPAAYGARIDEVLLVALAQAFWQWNEGRPLLIDLEGHGREDVFEDVDLSRTVGWFTAVSPILLVRSEAFITEDVLRLVQEQLGSIPDRGIGYGLLRYLSEDKSMVEQLQALPQAEIGFNYMGRLDQYFAGSMLELAQVFFGPVHSPLGTRRYLIEVSGGIVEEQFRLDWTYSENLHRRATIEALARDFVTELRSLIARRRSIEAMDEAATDLSRQARDGHAFTVVPAPSERYQPFPLSDMQQAYWIGRGGTHELGNVSPHTYLEFESVGLDLERLNLALQRVTDRHEMLRAIVLPDGRQQILEHAPYQIEVVDLRGLAPEIVATRLEAGREAMSHLVKPADQCPPFEARAYLLEEERVRLNFSWDSLMADAFSLFLLMREWFEFYKNPQVSIPPLELSFRDYMLAEIASRESEAYEQSLAYWTDRLPTLPPGPELPLAQGPDSFEYPRFVRQTDRLPPETWHRLKQRAKQAGLTPAMLLCAAFSEVLAAWSKEARFTNNISLFDRRPLHPQVYDVVGDFTSGILLETDHLAGDTFEARATSLQEQLWVDLEHTRVSSVRVLRELARTQGTKMAAMPVVFTCVLNLGKRQQGGLALTSWLGDLVYSASQAPQVWLDHQIFEDGEGLFLTWDSVKDLFPAGLMEDMFGAYCRLLRCLANEDTPWQQRGLALIPPEQLAQREAINATDVSVSSELLHTLFSAQVVQRPSQPAVVAIDRALTYQELDLRSNQVARRLRSLGVQPNQLVAVVMEKGWEQVVAVLGVLKAGGAYLPIEAGQPQERLWYLLENGEVEVVLTQSHVDQRSTWPGFVHRLCVDDGRVWTDDDHALDPVQTPDDLAYVIYTSGSTGQPKGVMIDHRGPVNTILDVNRRFQVGPEDRVFALSRLNFDLSVYDIFGTLAAGATIVMPQPSGWRDPAHWMSVMEREGVTIWNSVPALMEMLVDYAEVQKEGLPSTLRVVLMSGDWIPVRLPDRIRALGQVTDVISMGGATEASIWSILYPIQEVDPAWKSILYGKPMDNQRFYVLDQRLEPRPAWVPGELYIGGIGLAKGYWHDEEKTAASFIHHPHTGERLYRTGDLGRYLPDGNIEFLGREDFQVKVQGYRIELGEIEMALTQHPAVGMGVVMAVGERQKKRLVGYVAPTDGSVPQGDELQRYLKEKLPEHMVPSVFVNLDALPLTANGKVDRQALPPPHPDQLALRREGVARREATPITAKVARLAKQVLVVDHVAPEANLLDLGANSIDIVRMATLLEKEFGFRPGIEDLFRLQTVNEMSGYYEQQLMQSRSPVKANGAEDALLDAFPVLLDPEEREAFKRAQHGLRRIEGVDFSAPPAPDGALKEKYLERQSYRSFVPGPVAKGAFRGLLSCLRQITVDGKPKYLYGSAGPTYAVQTYLYVKPGGVEGISAGIYYYHPLADDVVPVAPEARIEEDVHFFQNRAIFDGSAFSLFLICQLGAIAPLYGRKSRDYALIETGLMAQLLEMSAPTYQIGLCQIGDLDFDKIRHLFVLEESHILLHSFVGGPVDWEEGVV